MGQGHGGEGETAASTDIWRPGGLEGGDSGLCSWVEPSRFGAGVTPGQSLCRAGGLGRGEHLP